MEALRAQLREVEQDLTRGVITETEAENARIELSRRLLAAADAAETERAAAPMPRGLKPVFGAVGGIAVPVIALAVYLGIGSPALPDQPLATRDFSSDRPNQEQAEILAAEAGTVPTPEPPAQVEGMPEMSALIERLKARMEDTPDDRRGLELLARSTARVGDYTESWQAFERLIALDPGAAPADFFAEMAEAMIMAAGGYVSPEAEGAIDDALARDDADSRARHFKALALAQRGQVPEALDRWIELLRDAPADAPWRSLIIDHARQAAAEIGAELPPAFAPPGPTAADRATAAEMAPEDRQAMIEGMVAGLAERLKDDPNDLEGWLRLIRAYRVMGRDDDAKAAQGAALEAFQDDVDATRRIETALP